MPLVGQQIGRYRILEQVGSGGMSVVYKGLDTALDREVAVKVLHPHLSKKEEARARLSREGRAVAKLHHPNILEVFDVSSEGALDAFLVTEFIRGKTLREFSQTERFHPPELAVMIIHALAAALAHAHQAGVIHRDIKPENVMVREDGVLKLMDFGIAKLLDRDERMTQTGALVGSPAHMAPEIIEGEEATANADIFSLGTLLYWLATGELPFSATNTPATLKRILDGTYEDPRNRNRAISDELAAIISRAMARLPKDRYPDAQSMEDALSEYLTSLGLPHPKEELTAFFQAPSFYRLGLTARLCETLFAQAEALVAQGRPARALGKLGQLLALVPDEPRAQRLVAQMNRTERRRRTLRRWTLAVMASAALVGAWFLGGRGLAELARRRAQRHQVAMLAPSSPQQTPTPSGGRPVETKVLRPASGTRVAPDPYAKRPVRPQPVKQVAIQVLVRPYGFVQWDSQPRSAEPLAQHVVLSTPGSHRITVSCDYCETTTQTVEVKAEGPNVFPIPAELKPGKLAFDFKPTTAVVRFAGQLHPCAGTLASPLEVRSPKGPVSFQHAVEYDVAAPGFKPEHRQILIPPGRITVIHGTLEHG